MKPRFGKRVPKAKVVLNNGELKIKDMFLPNEKIRVVLCDKRDNIIQELGNTQAQKDGKLKLDVSSIPSGQGYKVGVVTSRFADSYHV